MELIEAYDARTASESVPVPVASTQPRELTLADFERLFVADPQEEETEPNTNAAPVSFPPSPAASKSEPPPPSTTTKPTKSHENAPPSNKDGNRKNRRRRNRKNKRADGGALAAAAGTVSWPKVNPKLKPRISGETLKRLRADGTYAMSEDEARAHKQFTLRNSTVYSHDQRDPSTAVRLFSADDELGIVPHSVMWDTGAEVGICITTNIARCLGLTWSPGLQLVGVGGLGGAEGQADQEIIIRFGGDGNPDDVWSTEFNGVFAIKVRPIIMTAEMTTNIGHNVLIGTHVMWRARARFDPLLETVEISPALLRHGARDFCVTLPCRMTKPRPNALVAAMPFVVPEAAAESYLPPAKPTVIQPLPGAPPKPSSPLPTTTNSQSMPTIKPSTTTNLRDLAKVLINAKQAAMKAVSAWPNRPASKSASPTKGTRAPKTASNGSSQSSKPKSPATPTHTSKAPVAAPLHPGHPQKAPVATKEEYRAKRDETAARNSANRAAAREVQREAIQNHGSYRDALAKPRTPTLQEQFILETAKLRALITAQDNRVKALERTVGLLEKGAVPSRSAPLESTQRPVKEITPPLNVPVPAQPAAAPSPSPAPAQPVGGAPPPAPVPTPTPTSPQNNARSSKTAKPSKTKAPSTHNMQTRARSNQRGGPTIMAPARPNQPAPDALVPLEDARAWVLVTHKKNRRQRPGAPSARAAAATAAANAAASHTDNLSVMWVQILAAATLWAVYTMASHLVRRRRSAKRVVNLATLTAVACLSHQTIGEWTPIWHLVVGATHISIFAPAAWLSAAMVVALVVHWLRTEQRLFRQAVNL